MKLFLGVIDLPYADATSYTGRKPKSKPKGTQSTGDIADILEGKYHVMEVFAQLHGQGIADALARSYSDAVDLLGIGAPVTIDPSGEAMGEIKTMFETFIMSKEMDGLGIPGVATQAAKDGVSHRFKKVRGNRGPRPSFYDTGLYVSSFKAWPDF